MRKDDVLMNQFLLFLTYEVVKNKLKLCISLLIIFYMFSFGSYYNHGQKVLEADGELGEVWISGYNFAHDLKELEKNSIKAVCSGVDLHFAYPAHIKHLKFDLNDCHTQDARHTFKPAFQFIQKSRRETNVLVHCAAGISRCSTLLIAYMMQKYSMTFDECLKKIQSSRPCCQPNTGFIKQLRQLQKILGIQSGV